METCGGTISPLEETRDILSSLRNKRELGKCILARVSWIANNDSRWDYQEREREGGVRKGERDREAEMHSHKSRPMRRRSEAVEGEVGVAGIAGQRLYQTRWRPDVSR